MSLWIDAGAAEITPYKLHRLTKIERADNVALGLDCVKETSPDIAILDLELT